MRPCLFLLTICLLPFLQAKAQAPADTGSLTIVKDTMIDYLLIRHQQGYVEKKTASGYRVQLIASSDKGKVIQVKTSFLEQYPNDKIYMNYFQPNYRLRIGDFKTKIEANQYLKKILHAFPAAWVVTDTINLMDTDQE